MPCYDVYHRKYCYMFFLSEKMNNIFKNWIDRTSPSTLFVFVLILLHCGILFILALLEPSNLLIVEDCVESSAYQEKRCV